MAHAQAPGPVTLIVDGANVMGSRADGWWRDPVAAMTRLHCQLAALAAGGGYQEIVLVVEGRARRVAGEAEPAPGLRVVAAAGSGDDEIASLAGSVPGRRIVVTADRALRSRCQQAGAEVTGPSWLAGLLA
jgi:8-oxo-dGTP diphosphatase